MILQRLNSIEKKLDSILRKNSILDVAGDVVDAVVGGSENSHHEDEDEYGWSYESVGKSQLYLYPPNENKEIYIHRGEYDEDAERKLKNKNAPRKLIQAVEEWANDERLRPFFEKY